MPYLPPNRPLTVGLVQSAGSDDLAQSYATAEAGVRDCAARGAKIICLQELFASLYFCFEENFKFFDLAEPADGPTVTRFANLAKQLGVVLVIPFFERRAAGVYHNSVAVADADGTVLGIYRKMHIPDDPGYYEKFYFTPGDLGFKCFDTQHGKISVLICWDQWYPEAARLSAMLGAEVLFYPTAIGAKPGDDAARDRYRHGWQTVMQGHAVANGIFVAAVNRTGIENGMAFWGSSFIAEPMGHILAKAPETQPQNIVVTLDLGLVEKTRREWPFFRDRRIDHFQGLTRRFLND